MKRVVLCALNARYSHTCAALYYLREYCRDTGCEFIITELTINMAPLHILDAIAGVNPDAVCISVYIWNADIVRRILPEIKKILPHCVIVLGGPEVSHDPRSWRAALPCIDYIITGPGEASMRYLLSGDFTHDEKMLSMPNPHFSTIPFPYTREDLNLMRNRYIYYEGSRGCPHRCSYCLSSRTDLPLEHRDLETIQKELLFLMESRPRIVKFVDRTFNARRDIARGVWRFLIDNAGDTRFHFEVHPATLEDEDFDILSRAPDGLFQFEIGIQSTNAAALREIRRIGEWETVQKNVLALVKLGAIHIHLDQIVGLPFEDIRSIEQSFNDIYSLGGDHFQLGFLKVLPGTVMDEKKCVYGMLHTDSAPYLILANRWLTFDEITGIKKIEEILNAVYNTGKFRATLAALEPRFDSPFAFFSALARFWSARGWDHRTKDWRTVAERIACFAEHAIPHSKDAIVDSLRLDWSGFSTAPMPALRRPAEGPFPTPT